MATVTKSRSRLSKSARPTNGHGPGMFGSGPASGIAGDPSAWVEALDAHRARAERNTTVLKPVDLELGQLRPSPFQPRQSFPEDELKELAESIFAHGQLVPLICRHFPGSTTDGSDYELIDGEFRWRAAKLAGVKTLRAEVGDFSDAEAAKIVLVSALSRKDLNVIEEANGFARLIAMGVASGPTELARQLGLSQGHVSNQLRLLELPDAIRRRVISREMTARHAREVLPYAKTPAVLKALNKQIDREIKRNGDLATVEYFRENVLEDVVRQHTRPMQGDRYSYRAGVRAPIFPATEEQLRKLDVLEVQKDGKVERLATNVKAWDTWQEAWAKKYAAEQAGRKKGPKSSKKAAQKPAKKPTPAEEKARAEERGKEFREWLQQYLTDVRQWILARFLRGDPELDWKPSTEDVLRVAWFLAAGVSRQHFHCREAFAACDLRINYWPGNVAPAIGKVGDEDLPAYAGKVLSYFFYEEEPLKIVSAEDVWTLFANLGMDLETVWNVEWFGPHSEAFFQRQTKDQLLALAAEWKLLGEIKPTLPKSAMVAAFLAHRPKPDDKEATWPLPKEIRKCKLKK